MQVLIKLKIQFNAWIGKRFIFFRFSTAVNCCLLPGFEKSFKGNAYHPFSSCKNALLTKRKGWHLLLSLLIFLRESS